MKAHLRYFWYIVRHKWFVFIECCKLGIPWLGIVHDWSKFLPSEWIPYVNHFYGEGKSREDAGEYYDAANTGSDTFDYAWLYHQHRNKHHWQYWMLPQDDDEDKLLQMPDKYRREMLADWRGAGRAITGIDNTPRWYLNHKDKMQLHSDTRAWIERQLGI